MYYYYYNNNYLIHHISDFFPVNKERAVNISRERTLTSFNVNSVSSSSHLPSMHAQAAGLLLNKDKTTNFSVTSIYKRSIAIRLSIHGCKVKKLYWLQVFTDATHTLGPGVLKETPSHVQSSIIVHRTLQEYWISHLSVSKCSRSSRASLLFSWSMTTFCFSRTWLVGMVASPVCNDKSNQHAINKYQTSKFHVSIFRKRKLH